MAHWILIAALSLGASFQTQTIPFTHPHARIFPAHGDLDNKADIFVLDGSTLVLYRSQHPDTTLLIQLVEGTSAVDVADVDGDGHTEVIAVAGRRVMLYPLVQPQGERAPRVLFESPSYLASETVDPFLFVLVLEHDNEPFIGLPTVEGYELWRSTGKMYKRFPLNTSGGARRPSNRGFTTWSRPAANRSEYSSLELGIHYNRHFFPNLPSELGADDGADPRFRRATYSQLRDAANLDFIYWGWFPLTPNQEESTRVRYAATPNYRDTFIRLERRGVARPGEEPEGIAVSPKGRYPGALIVPDRDLPDFNGDGYVDLLLWKTTSPGLSVNALSRAAAEGSWPLTMSVHLYSPEKGRYEPRSAGHFSCRVPLGWFFSAREGLPVRHLVLRDFDGDGATDLAFSTGPRSFSLWLFSDGFSASPNYHKRFDETIEGIAFKADLEGSGATAVALHTKSAYHILSVSRD